MLAIVGTVPDPEFPLLSGEVHIEGDNLCIAGRRAPIRRGTPALLAAAIKTVETLNQPAPFAFLVGDIGLGQGSRLLYEHLTRRLSRFELRTLVFHYLQPDVDWHNKVLFAVDDMPRRPVLIADAGFMYAAKMSGQSAAYDLFTPDAGELAFLADEQAPHPFYTRGFILHEENRVPELIERAYLHENAARYLLVKGDRDYLADRSGVLAEVDHPCEEAMEAIGGTGDMLTGIVSGLIESGMEISRAAVLAARANRLAGFHTKPNPATQVVEIIQMVPRALADLQKAD